MCACARARFARVCSYRRRAHSAPCPQARATSAHLPTLANSLTLRPVPLWYAHRHTPSGQQITRSRNAADPQTARQPANAVGRELPPPHPPCHPPPAPAVLPEPPAYVRPHHCDHRHPPPPASRRSFLRPPPPPPAPRDPVLKKRPLLPGSQATICRGIAAVCGHRRWLLGNAHSPSRAPSRQAWGGRADDAWVTARPAAGTALGSSTLLVHGGRGCAAAVRRKAAPTAHASRGGMGGHCAAPVSAEPITA